MRDILFKAKRIDNGEWVEGGYFNRTDCYGMECDEHYIIDGTKTDMEGYGEHYLVDKDTICQYTGLTDKNGNKIWENDVVRGHGNPNDLAKIVFGEFCVVEVESLDKVDGVIGWHTEVIPTDAISKCEPFCLPMPLTDFYVNLSEWEVIGNIFDNPELLKAGEA